MTSTPTHVCGGFAADTLVRTRDGLVAIQNIRVGDLVLARPSTTGDPDFRRVVKTSVHPETPIFLVNCWVEDEPDNETWVFSTGAQSFFVDESIWTDCKGWTRAEMLEPNALLRLVDGRQATLICMQPVQRTPRSGIVWVAMDERGVDGCEFDFSNATKMVRETERGPLPADGDDPQFHTTAYGIEVDDFGTCHVSGLDL